MFALSLFCVATPSFAYHTLTLDDNVTETIADSFVRDDYSGSNYGTATYLHISKRIQRSYFLYNITALPDNASITSAIFSMYYYDAYGYGVSIGYYSTVHQLYNTSSWTETGITWSNQPCGTGYTLNNATCNTTYDDREFIPEKVGDGSTFGYLSWDVTNMTIASFNDPSTYNNLVSFLIKAESEEAGDDYDWERSFYSAEYNDTNYQPKLVIIYEEIPPTTTTTTTTTISQYVETLTDIGEGTSNALTPITAVIIMLIIGIAVAFGVVAMIKSNVSVG